MSVALILTISFALAQATTPADAGPSAAAARLVDAMTAGDGVAAHALFVQRNEPLDYVDQRINEVTDGRFKGARGTVGHVEQDGNLAIVEVNWEYKGHRVWGVMYLARRDERWLVFPHDGPPVIDHMVTDAERPRFRALVEAHEARRRERLEAMPDAPGAADPIEAARAFQSAVNARDARAIGAMSVQATMRLVDGVERRVKEMNERYFTAGELVVEASKTEGNGAVVIFRARGHAGALSERRSLLFVQRGDRWYLLPDFYGGNHTAKEFSQLHRLGQWDTIWQHDPTKRGPAPTRELAAVWGNEELPYAARAGNLQRVEESFRLGATASSSALEAALEEGRWEVAERLVEAGADVNGPGRDGWPLLPQSIRYDRQEQAKWLIEHSRGKLAAEDLADALQAAAGKRSLQLVRLLLNAGTDPRQLPRSRVPVLFACVRAPAGETQAEHDERIKIIQALLAAGADPLAQSEQTGASLLTEASGDGGDVKIVRLLLDLNVFDRDAREQAFRRSLSVSNLEIMALLHASGLSIEEMDRKESLLLIPIYLDRAEGLPWLLEHGANPNAGTAAETALLAAVRGSSAGVVKLLLENGGDPTKTDAQGDDAFALCSKRLAGQRTSEAWEIHQLLDNWRAARR